MLLHLASPPPLGSLKQDLVQTLIAPTLTGEPAASVRSLGTQIALSLPILQSKSKQQFPFTSTCNFQFDSQNCYLQPTHFLLIRMHYHCNQSSSHPTHRWVSPFNSNSYLPRPHSYGAGQALEGPVEWLAFVGTLSLATSTSQQLATQVHLPGAQATIGGQAGKSKTCESLRWSERG